MKTLLFSFFFNSLSFAMDPYCIQHSLNLNQLPHFQSFQEVDSFILTLNMNTLLIPPRQQEIKSSREPVPNWIKEFHSRLVRTIFKGDPRFNIYLCDDCGSTSKDFIIWLDLKQLRALVKSNFMSNVKFVIAHEMGHTIQNIAKTVIQPTILSKIINDPEDQDSFLNALMHAEVDLISMYLLNRLGVSFPVGGVDLLK